MQKTRRGFVKNLGGLVVGASILPLVSGCEDYGIDDSGSGGNGGNEGGLGNSFAITHPSVDKGFSFGQVLSNNDGVFSYNQGVSGNAYSYFVVDENHMPISGAEISIYDLARPGFSLASIVDPYGRFMPRSFELPLSGNMKGMNGRWMVLDKLQDAVSNGRAKIKNYVDNALPSWDWEKMDDNPGAIYTGDWSFNEIANWTHLLEKGSKIIAKIVPPTAVVYSIFSTSGKVVDVLDDAIEIINDLPLGDKFKIDKNKKHSFYVPGNLINPSLMMLEPMENILDNRPGKIQDFFVTQVGSRWNFRKNCSGPVYSAEVIGAGTVNEKEVVKINESGVISYFGFSGLKLGYVGFHEPGIGQVLFDPPICIGDGAIQKGKVYSGSSKVIFEDSNQTGEISERFEYLDRELVADCRGNPYGGCFKVKETCSLKMNGQTSDLSGFHWFAKDIGKVKILNNFGEFRLVDYESPNGKSSSENVLGSRLGLVDLILRTVKS